MFVAIQLAIHLDGLAQSGCFWVHWSCAPILRLTYTTIRMKTIYTLLAVLLLPLSLFAQQVIYVAPVPKTYWQQRADNRREALQLQTEQNRQVQSELNEVLSQNARCASEIRNYYAGLSDYPIIADGDYKVHATDSYYICMPLKAEVREGRVIRLGGDSVEGTEKVKNGKTKVLLPFPVGKQVKTLIMEVYFIY